MHQVVINRIRPDRNRLWPVLILCAFFSHAYAEPEDAEALFFSDFEEQADQVNEGSLKFIEPQHEAGILHSINTLTITRHSLETGWVRLEQCYEHLDAVAEAVITYQYKHMRKLELTSYAHINSATIEKKSVHLNGIRQGANICVEAEVMILSRHGKQFQILNGPYHRKFLDGYYPFHLSLYVDYSDVPLKLLTISPANQPRFKISNQQGQLSIDCWFEGKLTVDIRFALIAE